MDSLNLGILAHVDAGKTSLTEWLLFAAGIIPALGRVDEGTASTDTLALERRRGITISSAVVSFPLPGRTVNLIDTPGHPDFLAEVDRALGVLDGAVLVVSAVEGVQAQTRVLMRALRRLAVPVLIFVNKIDRMGARGIGLVGDLRTRLGLAPVPMGEVRGAGSRRAEFVPWARPPAAWLETLAERDENLLASFLAEEPVADATVWRSLRDQSRSGLVQPVFFGSALTGAGMPALMRGLVDLLPAAGGGEQDPLSARVFKIDRVGTERRAYCRVFGGTLRPRTLVPIPGRAQGKVTSLRRFAGSRAEPAAELRAGQIGTVTGLPDIRIGDWIGQSRGLEEPGLPPPSWETVVAPCDPGRSGELFTALSELAEQDPLIGVRRDPARGEVSVLLYGEVQKEVIADTLLEAYGLEVGFAETSTRHIERVRGVGSAVEIMGTAGNPFLATVGLRIAPAPPGAGVGFGLEIELGSMPAAFFRAVEETVRDALTEGLSGWPVPDATVIMTHSGYAPRQSHAHARFDRSMSSTGSDFRYLTALVAAEALRAAGTVVCEPIHRVRIEAPPDSVPAVLALVGRLGTLSGPPESGPGALTGVVTGEVAAARLPELGRRLPGLSRGEGTVEHAFASWEPVRAGPVPRRARRRPDPLERRRYLLETAGR